MENEQLLGLIDLGRWSETLQAFVLKDLQDPNYEIAASAFRMLEYNGDASVTDSLVASFLYATAQAKNDPSLAKIYALYWNDPSSGARSLLTNKRLQLSEGQKVRLQAMVRDEKLAL